MNILARCTLRPFVMPKTMPTKLELWDDSTSRWLFNDREQRALRHVDYNVQELISLACDSVGATGCAFNKVFRLTFNDSQTAIARIPSARMFGSGVSWSTASEVATLDSMRNVYNFRVPKVLAWGKDATNVVGSPYIILEDIAGVPLHREWSHPDTCGAPVRKMPCYLPLLPEIYRSYSAYEASSTVGPIADMLWWRPFHDEPVALERRAVQRHREDPSSLCFTRSKYEDLDEVERLLSKVEALAPRIDVVFSSMHAPEWSTHGSLVHPDLRAHNLIVAARTKDNIESRMNDPTVIDWQGTSILPFPFQAHIPSVIAFEPTIFDEDGNPMVSINENEVSPLPDLTQLSSEQRALAEAERRRALRQTGFVEAVTTKIPAWNLTLNTNSFPNFSARSSKVFCAHVRTDRSAALLAYGYRAIWGDVQIWGRYPFRLPSKNVKLTKRDGAKPNLRSQAAAVDEPVGLCRGWEGG
ncbi:hypothetical protein CPB85DRAFT_1435054 [Mucidula mucida]|nr:hypothetical protein CPB85DRAFT_1435054 [Mucidula mucida]